MLPDSESRLIKKIQHRGDREAANILIENYYKEIYAYTYRQTTDQTLAMDLTQDIFISMLKSIDGYDHKKSTFRTWLYRIATYKIIDYFRSTHYHQEREEIDIDSTTLLAEGDIACNLEDKESAAKELNLLEKKSAKQQQIFRLKVFGDYTFAQIAEMLLLPESTVKSCYYSAVRIIKKEMEELV